jgi:hypothetical protein
MPEPNEESAALSPSASELLDAWLRSQAVEPAPAAPDVAALVAYQSGALGEDAVRAVERDLAARPAVRALLLSTRQALRELRALPWSQVAREARSDALSGQVARAWLALTAESVGSAATARDTWRIDGWTAIRRQMAAGAIAAKSAWASFASFGDQIRFSIQSMPFAAARGGPDEPASIDGTLPPGTRAALVATMTVDGMLDATLSLRDPEGELSCAADGSVVALSLCVNEQTWPLASAVIEGGAAQWQLPEIGRSIQLQPGPIAAEFFSLSLGEPETEPRGEATRAWAEVVAGDGQPSGRLPVLIELSSPPRWESGAFHVAVTLPAPVRLAYAAYRLRLDVAVAGRSRQCLGYWPVASWSDTPLELTAECPGSPDAVAYPAVLHATLSP